MYIHSVTIDDSMILSSENSALLPDDIRSTYSTMPLNQRVNRVLLYWDWCHLSESCRCCHNLKLIFFSM